MESFRDVLSTKILGRVSCIRVTATEVDNNLTVLLALRWEVAFMHQVASKFRAFLLCIIPLKDVVFFYKNKINFH